MCVCTGLNGKTSFSMGRVSRYTHDISHANGLLLFVSNFFSSSSLSVSTASALMKSNSSHFQERSDLINKSTNFIFSQKVFPLSQSIMSWQCSQLCSFYFIAKSRHVYIFHGIGLDSCGSWPANGPFSTIDAKLAAYFCPFQSPDHIGHAAYRMRLFV